MPTLRQIFYNIKRDHLPFYRNPFDLFWHWFVSDFGSIGNHSLNKVSYIGLWEASIIVLLNTWRCSPNIYLPYNQLLVNYFIMSPLFSQGQDWGSGKIPLKQLGAMFFTIWCSRFGTKTQRCNFFIFPCSWISSSCLRYLVRKEKREKQKHFL